MVLALQCFVRISEHTATLALYIINWLVFITVVESVCSAVRTDALYKADNVSSLKGLTEVNNYHHVPAFQPPRKMRWYSKNKILVEPLRGLSGLWSLWIYTFR